VNTLSELKNKSLSSTSLEVLKYRADLMRSIRSFFNNKNILEVETPSLSQAASLDPFIDIFQTESFIDGSQSQKQTLYLQSSPEFHMKRLLVSHRHDIFQICKAFRSGENSPKHNWEFSILEWYRIDWTLSSLMNEVFAIFQLCFKSIKSYSTITYKDCFEKYLGINPFAVTVADLQSCALQKGLTNLNYTKKDDWLNYLLGSLIEPQLGLKTPIFLTEYPSSQAALARTQNDVWGNPIALRFELYYQGIELCNGFSELANPKEQRERFLLDQTIRKKLNKSELKMDENFLGALELGLPNCCGVAVGLDRMIMLALDIPHINQALSFGYENT
jgi:lysyl-tRNA synthetase class 2